MDPKPVQLVPSREGETGPWRHRGRPCEDAGRRRPPTPRGVASEETEPATTVISDFHKSEKIKLCRSCLQSVPRCSGSPSSLRHPMLHSRRWQVGSPSLPQVSAPPTQRLLPTQSHSHWWVSLLFQGEHLTFRWTDIDTDIEI